jgi:hypothetical protein
MNPIRRELLNALFVLVLSTLLSAGFAAFQVKFNVQLWVWLVIGVAVALGFYVMFELTLGFMSSAEDREKEWLKRVGTPARLELNREGEPAGLVAVGEAIKTIKPGSDYTVMYYVPGDEGFALWKETSAVAVREKNFSHVLELLKVGTIREYKRLVCFDYEVLASDPELKSGILRVGEGPGTISRQMGEHCRRMMETKGCSLYVAPAVLRFIVILYGADKVAITVDTAERTGGRTAVGVIFFSDPPNGEIIEQFRQMERETEKRMVAVREIRFPEDGPIAKVASS